MSSWKRSKPKDWDKSSPLQQRISTIQLGKKYGHKEQDFTDDEGNDLDRTMRDAIIEDMNKDYDVREAMKYGRDSGDKNFKDMGNSIGSMADAVTASRAIVKHGQKDDKDFNLHDDFADVSSSLFNASRDNFGDQFATKDDLSALEKQQADAIDQQTPYKESAELSQAKERVQAWEGASNQGTNPSPYGPSGSNMDFSSQVYGANRDASGEPANGEEAQGQLDKFKSELKERKNLQPTFGK